MGVYRAAPEAVGPASAIRGAIESEAETGWSLGSVVSGDRYHLHSADSAWSAVLSVHGVTLCSCQEAFVPSVNFEACDVRRHLRPAMSASVSSTPRRALLAAIYAATNTGCAYGFALYSAALKEKLSLSQGQVENLNTIPAVFGLINPVWGLLTKRFGPRVAILLGGVIISSMQILMYAIACSGISGGAAASVLLVCTVIQYIGVAITGGASFSTPVKHFPHHRSDATSLVKSFVGLGAAAVAQLFVLIFGANASDASHLEALLLWAGFSIFCTIVGVSLMPSSPEPDAKEPRQLLWATFLVLVALGGVIFIASIVPNGAAHGVLVVLLLMLTLGPLALGLGAHALGLDPGTPLAAEAAPPPTTPTPTLVTAPATALTTTPTEAADAGSDAADAKEAVEAKEAAEAMEANEATAAMEVKEAAEEVKEAVEADNMTQSVTAPVPVLETSTPLNLVQMLMTPEAWLLWWCGVVLMGGGLLLVTNLAQIVESYGAPDSLVPALVTLFSCGNFLGRLLAMRVSDALVRRGIARPAFVALDCLVAAVAQGMNLAAGGARGGMQSALLIVANFLGGAAFGAIWPHLVVVRCVASTRNLGMLAAGWASPPDRISPAQLASELFGTANIAINYMFYDGCCAAVGILGIGNLLPRVFYRPSPGSADCIGAHCFAPTFGIVAILSLTGVGTGAVLSQRSSALYREIAASRRVAFAKAPPRRHAPVGSRKAKEVEVRSGGREFAPREGTEGANNVVNVRDV